MKVLEASEILETFSTPEKVFLSLPLYQQYKIEEPNFEIITRVEFYTGIIDVYCPDCKKHSVFSRNMELPLFLLEDLSISHRHKMIKPPTYEIFIKGVIEQKRTMWFPTGKKDEDGNPLYDVKRVADYVISDRYIVCEFVCSRNDKHKLRFYFEIHNGCFSKSGQYPSIAELETGDLHKYRKVLKDQYGELTKAVGLYAHGIGVGAFIYLRRIFETLVRDAYTKATADPSWDASVWKEELRIIEKIGLLKNYLPTFLADNKIIYGILSKVVHEISEEEARAYFSVALEAILIILNQKIALQEQELHEQKIRKAILNISDELNNKK